MVALSVASAPSVVPGFATHEQARHEIPPKQVRHPTDCRFTSGCSPPRLAATQLPSITGLATNPGTDLHRADKASSRTHSCFGDAPSRADWRIGLDHRHADSDRRVRRALARQHVQFRTVLHRAIADAWAGARLLLVGPRKYGCKTPDIPSFDGLIWRASPRTSPPGPLAGAFLYFAACGGTPAGSPGAARTATTIALMIARFAVLLGDLLTPGKPGRRAAAAVDGAWRLPGSFRGHAPGAGGRAMNSPLTSIALFHIGPVPITQAVLVTWAIMAVLVCWVPPRHKARVCRWCRRRPVGLSN